LVRKNIAIKTRLMAAAATYPARGFLQIVMADKEEKTESGMKKSWY
jgi:hypothetical protein